MNFPTGPIQSLSHNVRLFSVVCATFCVKQNKKNVLGAVHKYVSQNEGV